MTTERPSSRWLGRVAQHRLAPSVVGLLALLLSLPALGVEEVDWIGDLLLNGLCPRRDS